MKDFIVKYWLECAFTAVTGVFAWAYRKLKKRVDEQELIKQGVLAILHDRLFQAGRHYITLGELKNIEYLYTSYHNLGGNGTGTEIWERIKELPIKEGENNHGNNFN